MFVLDENVMIERKAEILFFAEMPLQSALSASLKSTLFKCPGGIIFCWKKVERRKNVKRQCWSAWNL